MKQITVLGSTGSIGVNTLKVIEANPGLYDVYALGAGRNAELLASQINRFNPKVVAVRDTATADALPGFIGGGRVPEILVGTEGYRSIASLQETDTVVSAMSGAAGLLPTLEAVSAGKNVALANKETMVMAGGLVIERAKRSGARLLPIDSEHSAIFQCLQGHNRENLRRVIITASGGPFRTWDNKKLASVTPEQALRHPNWSMGRKISIDSATLMNKGLEVIEAKWFFDLQPRQIDVIVHPESIIHSMVEYCDGSIIAQMGIPDMRTAISYSLSFPEHSPNDLPPLSLEKVGALTFEPPDVIRFPCLRLALEALESGGTAPATLNAANEIAVAAFLEERIEFLDIAVIIAETLGKIGPLPAEDLDTILESDAGARQAAEEVVGDIRQNRSHQSFR
jgi:1-deoxy-D-xylulose-5-phosphate reductoisomerase